MNIPLDICVTKVGQEIRHYFLNLMNGQVKGDFDSFRSMSEVTTLLDNLGSGADPRVAEKLLETVYNELRIIAKSMMNRERPGHTLQPTILVNDAWLKMFPDGKNPKFNGRSHFFGTAAKIMRRILVNHARKKNAKKRGGDSETVVLSDAEFANLADPATPGLVLAMDEALTLYAKIDQDTVNLIELRFFVGMAVKEASEILGLPKRNAEREFALFSAWFQREYGNEIFL